jgi:DNA invertase Pin-like site-specific DNA recombinase
VSTEQEDQVNSLENQKQFFERYINQNLEWRFCGLYVDEGITGTSVAKRAGFLEMIKDAESGKFDLIFTKEISRFARNTLDSIYYTRKLKALGIGVFFMNDNINTLDPDAELRLTIMSSIAQEESRKTSQRVRWGQKRQMEKGVVFGTGVYGYHLENGKLTVNETEAEVVRLIFLLYIDQSMGAHLICKELDNRGIPSPAGDSRWKNASVLRMLKNEKYIGTLKQKKFITTDYLSHKKILNTGAEEYVIIENNHPPLIDREIFEFTQRELERRRKTATDKSKHSNTYAWSGRIRCGLCGATFLRKTYNTKSDNPQIVWKCNEASRHGTAKENDNGQTRGCDCKGVHEPFLRDAMVGALQQVVGDTAHIVKSLKDAVRRALSDSPNPEPEISSIKQEMGKVDNRKSKLIELYTEGAINRAEFDRLNDQYNKQRETLAARLVLLDRHAQANEDLAAKLRGIDAAIESLAGMTEWSDSVCREVLDKAVVQDREKISFYFKTSEVADAFFLVSSETPSIRRNQQSDKTAHPSIALLQMPSVRRWRPPFLPGPESRS